MFMQMENYPYGNDEVSMQQEEENQPQRRQGTRSDSAINLNERTKLFLVNTELLRRKYGEEISSLLMIWVSLVYSLSNFKQ